MITTASDNQSASAPSWLRDVRINLRTDDRFGVDGLVDRLVQLLIRAPQPFTLSLSGEWGVGKSTIAEAVVDRLTEQGIRAVAIDVWTSDVADLRRNVVIEVGAALTDDPDAARKRIAGQIDDARASRTETGTARVQLRDAHDAWANVARHPMAFLLEVLLLELAGVVAVAIGRDSGLQPVFSSLATLMATLLLTSVLFKIETPSVTLEPATAELALATLFKSVVTVPPTESTSVGPLVIVVDNLDRLSGAEALKALAEIRSLVDIPRSRCVFFIPIDLFRLAEHLEETLGDATAASDFLEKFFNLDLPLPAPEPVDLAGWAMAQASRLFPGVEEVERRSVAEIAVTAAGGSPRTIIRIINGASTRYAALHDTTTIQLRQLAFVEGLL